MQAQSIKNSNGWGNAPTHGHPNYSPTPFSATGAMLNTANAVNYAGQTAGSFLDTVGASATVYFSIADSNVNLGWTPYMLPGWGQISFGVNVVKISGTPTGTVTLQSSPDGVNWASRSYTTPMTDTMNLVTAVTTAGNFKLSQIKDDLYYRLKVVTTSTAQSESIRCNYTCIYPNYNQVK